ncbi:C-GCAxxG-C-C family protein [Oceanispirochaeta sp.]|jgi:C_GCAxxG_C_C family probable redox protein|uniref:C-GCAxxG-C-C family protein n=1 Tax=Oceanispirochaeta sp. TaxID=2035350 RepID=UPI00262059B4|nr:C-GCAxxG-C-C family protein [Oceanispirochaeta sp.]MDA3958869.1 C-GCAxxG-C-C family protein [Oceanispirochaeta sp.]
MNNGEDPLDRAIHLHKHGFNSAQSILGAYHNQLGIDAKTAMNLAAGFGAGIGTMQKTCGALTGALMVLGCRYYDSDSVFESKQILFEKSQNILLSFHRKFGSTDCISLLKIDFHKAGGLQKAREQHLFDTHCQSYIREICRLLNETGL